MRPLCFNSFLDFSIPDLESPVSTEITEFGAWNHSVQLLLLHICNNAIYNDTCPVYNGFIMAEFQKELIRSI